MAYKHGKELPKKGDDAVDALRYAVYHLYSTGLLRLNDETPAPAIEAEPEEEDVFPSASAIVAERIRRRREEKQAQVGYGRWNFFGGELRL
jgi:hypothetical protein